MAAEPFTTTRRTLLGAAAALPAIGLCEGGSRPVIASAALKPVLSEVEGQSSRAQAVWNRRLAAYRRLAARTKEAAETGFYRQALDRYDREVAAIKRRFGGRTDPEARRLIRVAFERVDAVEEAYYDRCTAPMQRAAVRLALTPAPDLEALLAKIRVMHEQELAELGSMPRPVLEMLADDVVQLSSGF
ncbi:MAG TPA: hypothetical protein VF603_04655 [Allosphingosinicella sp.]|jgi:hypothetical protein